MEVFLGKITLICIHFLCAKEVKSGRQSNRLASIFFTLFMLNAFPIGTLLAVIMLFFSIFKWEKDQTQVLICLLQKLKTDFQYRA